MMQSPTTTKNIELAFEVLRQYLADPSVREGVSELGAEGTLVLYDENDETLTAANDRIAAAYEDRGEPVVRVAVQRHLILVPR